MKFVCLFALIFLMSKSVSSQIAPFYQMLAFTNQGSLDQENANGIKPDSLKEPTHGAVFSGRI